MHPHGPHGFDQSFGFLSFLGSFFLLTLLALAIGAFYLHSRGRLRLPVLGAARSPEEDAKRILADRFARGDLSTEEFMERSSILNWTPGSDTVPAQARKRRR